ncbi:hypothetical protein D3C73_826450 [compost metagenome]
MLIGHKTLDFLEVVIFGQHFPPCHRIYPFTLGLRQYSRVWQFSALSYANRLSISQFEQAFIIRLFVIIIVDISRQYIHLICTRIIGTVRICPLIRSIRIPYPQQIIQFMLVHQPVVRNIPKSGEVILLPPPEPVSVHLVIRTPQHRNSCIPQLPQIDGNLVK